MVVSLECISYDTMRRLQWLKMLCRLKQLQPFLAIQIQIQQESTLLLMKKS